MVYELAKEFYEDYPDPMPAFAFSGGEAHGQALLESALAEPRQTFGGRYLRRTIYDKAAALVRSLVKDHPLYDGNKRLALACLFVFLINNGVAFYVPRKEAVRVALRVARGEAEVPEIASWIRRHSVARRHGIPPRWGTKELRREMRRASRIIRQATPRVERLVGALKGRFSEVENQQD